MPTGRETSTQSSLTPVTLAVAVAEALSPNKPTHPPTPVISCVLTDVLLLLLFTGYMSTIHRPENHLILVHCPEILDADRNRE